MPLNFNDSDMNISCKYFLNGFGLSWKLIFSISLGSFCLFFVGFSFPLRWFSEGRKCQTGLSEKRQLLVGDSARRCHL